MSSWSDGGMASACSSCVRSCLGVRDRVGARGHARSSDRSRRSEIAGHGQRQYNAAAVIRSMQNAGRRVETREEDSLMRDRRPGCRGWEWRWNGSSDPLCKDKSNGNETRTASRAKTNEIQGQGCVETGRARHEGERCIRWSAPDTSHRITSRKNEA